MATLAENVQTVLVHALMALPEPAKRALAGKPVEIDGNRLGTETQLMLRLQRLARLTPAEQLPWAPARDALAMQSRIAAEDQFPGK